jgi:hypothetical protein
MRIRRRPIERVKIVPGQKQSVRRKQMGPATDARGIKAPVNKLCGGC